MECFKLPASYFVPSLDERATQKVEAMFYGTPVPYFEPTNIKGLRTGEIIHSNSTLTFPESMHLQKGKFIATLAPDNSMNKLKIKRGTCLIINTEKKEPEHGELFAAIKGVFLIIRRFYKDESGSFMVAESTRIPSGQSMEEIPQEDFSILGIIDKIVVNP